FTGAGLVGAAWGWVAWPVLPTDPARQACVLIGTFFLSVVIADIAESALRSHDDSRIVIDEFIGYWVSVAFLSHRWQVGLVGFILFRLFDVWKPLGIKRLQNWSGGWGVVCDDVLAGLYANLCLR